VNLNAEEWMTSARKFFSSMAIFWLFFGLGTTFYPRMMQWFMTPEGVASSTAFSDHVWLHDGLDILSVCLLLFALAAIPATKRTLILAAVVGVLPAVASVYGIVTTPYWTLLLLGPATGCFAFAVWGFALSRTYKEATS
jgi:hypothetical protein